MRHHPLETIVATARAASKPEVFDVDAESRGIGDMLDGITGARIRVAVDASIHPCFTQPSSALADLCRSGTSSIAMAVSTRDAMRGGGGPTPLRLRDGPMPLLAVSRIAPLTRCRA